MRSQLSNPNPHPGTPGYKSPEQVSNLDVLRPPSDIYALGILLFEMLTGRNYTFLRPGTHVVSLRPEVPDWLDELLASMLAKSAEERPWNGQDVADLLRAGLQQQSDQKKAEYEAELQHQEQAFAAAEKAQLEAITAEELRKQKLAEEQAAVTAEKARREAIAAYQLRKEKEASAVAEKARRMQLEAEEETRKRELRAQRPVKPSGLPGWLVMGGIGLGLMIMMTVVFTRQPAAPATEAPAAPATTEVLATEVPAVPTEVPPTAEPTVAPTPEPPTATPAPAPICAKMENAPVVEAGKPGSADNPIVIAFVPSGDTGKITKAGTAIADCLAEMTGLAFNIEVGTSFAASIEAMGAEKAQVGFLNTFSILLAQAKYPGLVVPVLANLRKYTTNAVDPDAAMAGQMQPFYKGQFIASEASGVKSFADLKGKSFCFVDQNSTSGFIIPNIVLKAEGIDIDADLKAYQFAGSHNNVAIAVYKGDCDAGVTFIDVLSDSAANLAATYPDIATKVTAFADTVRIPNDGVQYISSLDPAIQTAITSGLLAMTEDPGGKFVLKSLYSINGFQEIDPTFYNDFADVLKAAGVDPAELVK